MFAPILDRRFAARWTTLLLVFGILSALMMIGVQNANAAAVIYVTPNQGEGTSGDAICSLREAVVMAGTLVPNPDCPIVYGLGFASGNNVVYVPAGTYNLQPVNGPLVLRQGMRLRGPQVNIPAGNIETFTTRPIVASSEAIIRYNGNLNNLPIIEIRGANIEVEGLTLAGGPGTQTNVYGVNVFSLYTNIEISNTIFSDLTFGLSLRTAAASTPNDVVGNAFVNLTRTGTLRGVGINVPSINGLNIQIEGNLFLNLPNYGILFPTIGTAQLASSVTISRNGFNSVSAAMRLNRVDSVGVSSNRINTVTGSPLTYPAAITIINSTFIDVTSNSVVSSSIPAVATVGTSNANININYNRFYNTDLAGGANAVNIQSGSMAGAIDISDNWWGDNSGPGGLVNGFADPDGLVPLPPAFTWLAYQLVVDPAPIGLPDTGNSQAVLFVDFFSTNDGTTNLNDLTGTNVIRRGTDITVQLPLVPAPIGLLNTGVVEVEFDQTNRFVFSSDATNPGTQPIQALLDNELVTFNLNVNTPLQVVCDFNDGLFGDAQVLLSEGTTVGDRCILRLTDDPGAGNFVDVTINAVDTTLIGFYNSGAGNLSFTNPPNSTFTIRFGTVGDSNAVPVPVVAWNTGVSINFNALDNALDPAGAQHYPQLVDCGITNIIGTPGYVIGDCPGLSYIPVTIYDPGVEFIITDSDLDLGINEIDVCTFPTFSRTYNVVLSGPPGLEAAPPTIGTETVTVSLVVTNPGPAWGITLMPSVSSLTFTRGDWNTPKPVTITRMGTPFNTTAPDGSVAHNASSDAVAPSLTVSRYGLGLVSTTLTVNEPGCPLIDGKEGANVDVTVSQAVSAASVNVGDALTYAVIYSGAGLEAADPAAAGVVITVNLPSNVAFFSIGEQMAAYCAAPNEGEMGPATLTCVIPAGMAVNGGVLAVQTIAAAPGAATVTADVSVFGANDIDAGNNASAASAQIN